MASKYFEKSKLISDLDRSRIVLKQDFRATRDQLNFGARIKSAVLNAPVRWMVGAAVTGLIFGALLRGSPKTRLKAKQAKLNLKLAKRSMPTVPPPTVPSAPAGSLFAGMPAELLKFTFLAAKPLLLAYATTKATDFAAQLKVRDKQRRKK